MPYPKARLLEALHVIRDDVQRRHDLEAEKLARTQYREGFHLRKTTSVNFNVTNVADVWHDWDDSSDDEYSPGTKKRGRKSNQDADFEDIEYSGKRKRRSGIGRQAEIDGENCGDQRRRKRQKSNTEEVVLDQNHGFVSLKFLSKETRDCFREITKNMQPTRNNTYSSGNKDTDQPVKSNQWGCSSGGLHRVDRSATEQKHDHDVAILVGNLDLEEKGILRSGKRRSMGITPKKRKNDDSGIENVSEVEVKDVKENKKPRRIQPDTIQKLLNTAKQVNVSTPIKTGARLPTSPDHPSGQSLEDAIMIDDISSDDNDSSSCTSPSRFSYNSNSTSTQRTTPLTSPPIKVPSPLPNKPQAQALSQFSSAAVRRTTSPAITTQFSTQLVLTTHFSHPINFKSANSSSCSFHTDYRHGLLGYGPVIGEYLVYSTHPSQLIEISNGHRSSSSSSLAKKSPDTMCVPCALAYLQITRCDTHTFRPYTQPASARFLLSQTNATQLLVRDIWTPLKRGNPQRNTKPPVQSCSLCFAPAKHVCCAAQARDTCMRPCRMPGEDVDAAIRRIGQEAEEGRGLNASGKATVTVTATSSNQIRPPLLGCGLKLCGRCVVLVRNRCAGRLQENRALVLREVRAQPMGARADVEFLFREGLVWKAYHQDLGASALG